MNITRPGAGGPGVGASSLAASIFYLGPRLRAGLGWRPLPHPTCSPQAPLGLASDTRGEPYCCFHPYGWKAGVQWGLNLPGPARVFGADRPSTLFPSHLLPPRSTGEWARPTD